MSSPHVVVYQLNINFAAPKCLLQAENDDLETDEDVMDMLKSIHEQQPPYLYGSGLEPGVRAKLTRLV